MTVIVILAMIALGMFLIHRLNSQHSERIAAFHYARSGMPVAGPAPSAPTPRKTRGRRPSRRRSRTTPPPSPHP
ncbi:MULTISPECIES: hypothetical protein [unclassified Streptomyces]|uniref:hypothetical protein n=1 Tax=unclassified Streptomyces TaxID=2593676 RepID=UPI000A647786|nr:hypothetical protein [Streptomyces sp. Root1310]